MTTKYVDVIVPLSPNVSDPAIEQALLQSGETVLCRATGQPSLKTIATPCIIAFVFIGVICVMVAIIATTGGEEGGGVPTIAIALPPILMGGLVILFLIWLYSISRQVWFVAITPTRVITVRRGGICTNYMISVPLAEIVQMQSNQAPAGICCAPGPFLALNTIASLQSGRNGGAQPAVAVAMNDGETIGMMCRTIETARAAIPGVGPLSTSIGFLNPVTSYTTGNTSYTGVAMAAPVVPEGAIVHVHGETQYTPHVIATPAVASSPSYGNAVAYHN